MRRVLAAFALGAVALLAGAPSVSAQVGSPAPEFQSVKWYQSPPLTMEQLRGKAVLLVVFRTW